MSLTFVLFFLSGLCHLISVIDKTSGIPWAGLGWSTFCFAFAAATYGGRL